MNLKYLSLIALGVFFLGNSFRKQTYEKLAVQLGELKAKTRINVIRIFSIVTIVGSLLLTFFEL